MNDETYRKVLIATLALIGFALLTFSIVRDCIGMGVIK